MILCIKLRAILVMNFMIAGRETSRYLSKLSKQEYSTNSRQKIPSNLRELLCNASKLQTAAAYYLSLHIYNNRNCEP